jgi:hypothetical protein
MTVKEVTQIILAERVLNSKKAHLFKIGDNLRTNKIFEENNHLYACTDNDGYIYIKQ